MKKSMIAGMAAVFLLQACATIVHTSEQKVQINTVPPGISARIGTQDCVTPCTLNVPRASDRVYLRKGKTEKEYYLDKGYNLGSNHLRQHLVARAGSDRRFHCRRRLYYQADQCPV